MNTTGSDAEWVRLAGSILPLLLIVVIGMTLLLYRKELRDLIGGIKQVKYKEFTADFDSTARNAFTAAAENVWKRPDDKQEYLTDPDLYFSDADFRSAKQLATMRPVRRWLPIISLRVRRDIRSLVYDLADLYRKIRAEPPGNDRTKRASAVVARMRLLAFAAYPMLEDLIADDSAGERVAAIAFLQVTPCFRASALEWLGERISLREGKFVQYHAAGALLVACRNAEARDMKVLRKVVEDAIQTCERMPAEHRSEKAPELLAWCASSLSTKPYCASLTEVQTGGNHQSTSLE